MGSAALHSTPLPDVGFNVLPSSINSLARAENLQVAALLGPFQCILGPRCMGSATTPENDAAWLGSSHPMASPPLDVSRPARVFMEWVSSYFCPLSRGPRQAGMNPANLACRALHGLGKPTNRREDPFSVCISLTGLRFCSSISPPFSQRFCRASMWRQTDGRG